MFQTFTIQKNMSCVLTETPKVGNSWLGLPRFYFEICNRMLSVSPQSHFTRVSPTTPLTSSSSTGEPVQAVGSGETNRGRRAFYWAVISVHLLSAGACFWVGTSGRVTPTFSFPSSLVLTDLYTLLLSRFFVPFCLPFPI